MPIIIKYVFTLIAAGILGISAQGEAKSHKEKSHKDKCLKEKKSHKHEKKEPKLPEITPDPIILPDPEVIPEVTQGALDPAKPSVNVQVGKGLTK